MLEIAGTVLHLARSGRLIVKASSQVHDGTILVDEKGRRAGRVMETIGPASSPYLSVQPGTDRIERIVGTKLFVAEPAQGEFPRRNLQREKFRGGKMRGRRQSGKPNSFKRNR